MRHGRSDNRLSRNKSWRKATVRDIAKATLVHQRVQTTKARAKEARKLVDRLITLGKKDTLAARRKAYAILCDHQLVSELFKKTALRFKERPGGYTRIIPFSYRRGDHAPLVFLELTDKEESQEPKKSKLSGLKGKKKSSDAKAQEPKKESSKTSKKKTKGPQEAPEAQEKQQAPEEPAPAPEQPKEHKDKEKSPKEQPKKKIIGNLKQIFRKDSRGNKGQKGKSK